MDDVDWRTNRRLPVRFRERGINAGPGSRTTVAAATQSKKEGLRRPSAWPTPPAPVSSRFRRVRRGLALSQDSDGMTTCRRPSIPTAITATPTVKRCVIARRPRTGSLSSFAVPFTSADFTARLRLTGGNRGTARPGPPRQPRHPDQDLCSGRARAYLFIFFVVHADTLRLTTPGSSCRRSIS